MIHKQSKAVEKLIKTIPRDRDFSIHEIANILYPDSVKYDSEGRVSNRAAPVIARMMMTLKGVLNVGNGVFYVPKESDPIFNNLNKTTDHCAMTAEPTDGARPI